MLPFQLTILGCGSTMPTLQYAAPAQVLNVRNKLFLIDCGEGTQTQWRKYGLPFHRLCGIFLSHLHGDHCLGLMGLCATLSMLGRTAPLSIYAPYGSEEVLRAPLDFFCSDLRYKITLHIFDPTCTKEIYADRTVRVSTLPLDHSVPCAGFYFEEMPLLPHLIPEMLAYYNIPTYARAGIKQGDGWTTATGVYIPHSSLTTPADPPRSYAYCSDTRYSPNLSRNLANVDLLYHEATFLTAHASRAATYGHSTAAQAAQMAQLCHTKQLIIGHCSARYEDKSLLLSEAKTIFPSTLLAYDGLVLDV